MAKEAEKAEKLRKFNEKQKKKEQQLAEAQVLLNFLEKFYLNKYFRKKRKLIMKESSIEVQLLPNIHLRQKLERKKVIKINI